MNYIFLRSKKKHLHIFTSPHFHISTFSHLHIKKSINDFSEWTQFSNSQILKLNTTIFISRHLAPDSIFSQLLSEKARILDMSLVEFQPLGFELPLGVDWLFFYSKTGVEYFFSKISFLENFPKIAVIGQGTADFLNTNYQVQADFVGTGEPNETAAQFLELAKNKKVAFVQAENSKESVEKILDNQVVATKLIVYKNIAKTDFELPNLDILVFTSPMNAEAYFNKYTYQPHQKVLSIGQSTAQALKKYPIDNVMIAKEPNEGSLAEICLELIVGNG